MNVSELIKHLQEHFEGDEKIWFRCSCTKDDCYSELSEKEVVIGAVYDYVQDIEEGPVCIIGDAP